MLSEPGGRESGRTPLHLTGPGRAADPAPSDPPAGASGHDDGTECRDPGHAAAAAAVPAERPELGLVAGFEGTGVGAGAWRGGGTPAGAAGDEQWQERALCAQTDPEAFFPEKGGSTREAKRICQSCEVRLQCLEYALEHDERFGIWGGLSERERRRLKKGIV